jgi:hypothetical protein
MPRRLPSLRILLACIVLLLLPASAHAVDGQVYVEGDHVIADMPDGVVLDRRLVITSVAGGVWFVQDEQSQAVPGPGCAWVIEPTSIFCEREEPFTRLIVNAGPGNDHVFAFWAEDDAVPVSLYGEGGDDQLLAGYANDHLDGGPGNDILSGGCGVDTYQGGPGRDVVSYLGDGCPAHVNGVVASLDPNANDGPELENIGYTLTPFGSTGGNGIEGIWGTDGDDVLVGDMADNELRGHAGNDRIDGRAGNDLLEGGPGNDLLIGGPGRDVVHGDLSQGRDNGDDDIRIRDSAQDVVTCGGGTDSVIADSAEVDRLPVDCEQRNQSASAPGAQLPPGGPNDCPASRKSTKIGALVFCYGSSRRQTSTSFELLGDVTINNRVYLDSSAPVVVDVVGRNVTFAGTVTVGVIHAGTRIPVYRVTRSETFSAASGRFSIPISGGAAQVRVAGMDLGMVSTGIVGLNGAIDIDVLQGSVMFNGGVSLLDGALAVSGRVGATIGEGLSINLRGCLNGQSLPIGGAQRVAELRNVCVRYDKAERRWILSADATLFEAVRAKAGAELVAGTLNSFDVDLAGATRVPISFGAYVNGGGISVGGIRSGAASFAGRVHGGWPHVPVATGADLTITGEIGYHAGRRELTISGVGTLKIGSEQLADGTLSLKLGLGTNFAPNSLTFNTNVNAFGGFIQGAVTASVDNTFFFASATVRLGFQEGAEVTRLVNTEIERFLGCDWAIRNWCPYVTGLSASVQAVVSSKGAGGKGTFGPLSAAVWWLSSTRSYGYDLGFRTSTSLDFLGRAAHRAPRFGDIAGEQLPRAVDSPAPTATQLTIPPGTKIAALRLQGSTSGELVLRNPNGVVVADTATDTFAPGVHFGREPEDGTSASLGILAPAIMPGTWTVRTTGEQPFTAVRQVVAGDPGGARVTGVTPVGPGVRPGARQLVGGSSRLEIRWEAPVGTRVTLRASTPNGRVSLPIRRDLPRTGSLLWTVPATWAGNMRIMAATERDGVPTDSSLHPTTWKVARRAMPATAGVTARRLAGGRLALTWRRSAGATAYDVEVLVAGRRKPTVVSVRSLRTTLTPRTARAIRIRVRSVSAGGLPGPWSRPAAVQPIPAKRVSARR